ncbi:cysteine synthase A [Varibaculum cambriense]|uniref:cysteine synthase A n=1 Tax=Varibaculum cambriense TaxID=184870 RepID=UPI0025565127|nr:cysteine synthase A [Varibaculum cambriense]MDK8275406.1 cysteine synthase A [Varibaculum cambriense]
MNIAKDVTELVGRTPLVKINHLLPADFDGEVVAKVESFNPASSVKDRVALAMINAAEASGKLQPGGTLVESTSGNTGVALAMVGAARGYKVVITMPESMSKERRALMRAFGAELVLTPAAAGMQGTVDAAQKVVAEREGAILASQFTNPANPQAHFETTAEEIWADADGQVDVFVAGIGTGGTVTGVGRRLKELNPNIQIFGIEPAESALLTTGEAGAHGIQGIGANFVPDILDSKVLTKVLTVKTEDAIAMARKVAAKEGLLVGISAGAALMGALRLAQSLDMKGKRIVTLLPDTGERYLTTPLFKDLMD